MVPWVVSAKTEAALHAQVPGWCRRRTADPDLHSADVGYSLACRRSVFEHRAVLLVYRPAGLWPSRCSGVPGAVQGGRSRSCSLVRVRSGWGWAGSCMARFPVFAEALDAVLAELDAWVAGGDVG